MSDMKNWTVLVVEDEADGQEVVQGILGYFDIGTDAVGTAEDAIALLRQRHYNAAVVDIGLPGMTGLELVQYIRDQKAFAHLPCIAITAYHTSQLKQDAFEVGFDAYFPKPLDDTSFVRELDRIISNG